mgnify:CR=1 FL=1
MDDMKRLIEKYKQELMEYSKAAAPKENLTFPEMIEEKEAAQKFLLLRKCPLRLRRAMRSLTARVNLSRERYMFLLRRLPSSLLKRNPPRKPPFRRIMMN